MRKVNEYYGPRGIGLVGLMGNFKFGHHSIGPFPGPAPLPRVQLFGAGLPRHDLVCKR